MEIPVLGRLLLLFVLVPLVELVLLLWLADTTSWQFTLLLVVVTGATGVWLVRRQGLRTWPGSWKNPRRVGFRRRHSGTPS